MASKWGPDFAIRGSLNLTRRGHSILFSSRPVYFQSCPARAFTSSSRLRNVSNAATSRSEIPLGLFLWKRIRQLGVKSVMGLPGDMNLELLHYMKDANLNWVGNSNELNAAYAADGYSRIGGCTGVLLTTMAVGELSAINGIAGSYAENVKIVHVIAATGRKAQESKAVMHHTLGSSPNHRIYEKMSAPVRVAHCYLDDEKTAATEIDRVIHECHIHSRPVYIYVPVDMVHKPISTSSFDEPLLISRPESIEEARIKNSATEEVLSAIYSSKKPILLVDSHVLQFGAKSLVRDLAEKLQFPVFCPFMGKSIIEESKKYFYGTYNGKFSYPGVQEAVEDKSDLVIHLGPLPTDMNTGGFTAKVDPRKLISVEETRVIVRGKVFEGVYLKSFITALLSSLNTNKLPGPEPLTLPTPPTPTDLDTTQITQSYLWPRLGRFFRDGDIVFADGGTTHFGLQDATFPDITYVMQNHWASIGYATPAAFGGALAKRNELVEDEAGKTRGKGRVVLITGEGAIQLSVQEVGSMVKEGLPVIIIIINNGGYSIERCVIHPDAGYHDIATWDHNHMLEFFGVPDGVKRTHQVHTKDELETALELPEMKNPKGIQVLEIFTDKMDFPWRLKAFGRAYRDMKGQ
ncbi:related to pyruvate decarboxylase [Phialocephala subalpina]|uniref:Pyruvate decarboxylase n=1 Tax=Phialocephala subalpina TaxID=576137 RepID=A0A1L7X1D8_9HELO|nr:related to pyruvate decarboxylase [Phialocephala subalpina]